MLFELNFYKVKPGVDVDLNKLFTDNDYLREYIVAQKISVVKIAPINYYDVKEGMPFQERGLALIESGKYNTQIHRVNLNENGTCHIQLDVNDENLEED